MNYKEQVLNIFPSAIVIEDVHNYGSNFCKFLILKDKISDFLQIKNDVYSIDFTQLRNKTIIHPLSVWSISEEDAWKNALIQLENKIEEKLSI